MNFISAIAPNRGMVAVYTQPKDSSISNSSSNSHSKRLVIKCYDSSVSIGTLKFTLSANLNKLSDGDGNGAVAIVNKLQFSSNEYLLVSVSVSSSSSSSNDFTNKILVFDLNRGVHSQTVDLPFSLSSSPSTSTKSPSVGGAELCATTARENLIYALYKKDCKTIVTVHDIRKEGRVVHKVKCGSCDDDHDRLSIAVHPKSGTGAGAGGEGIGGLMGVWIGKKVKIVQIESGKSLGKFKIKSKDGGTKSKTARGKKDRDREREREEMDRPLLFSPDGTFLLASTPNGAHIFSIKTWEKVGVVNAATDICGVHLYPSSQGKYVGAIISSQRSKVFLVEINPSNKKKNVVIEPFATITLPSSSSNSNSKIIKEAFFTSGSSGGSEALLLELTPRGMNNVDVSMVQVPYKDYGSNQLQSGELYPKPGVKGDEKGGTGAAATSSSALPASAADDGGASSKKRKAPPTTTNVVLGPGESGGEAMTVTDQTTIKRPKVNNNNNNNNSNENDNTAKYNGEGNNDGDNFVLEQGDEAEETIAQKLAFLSSELDRDTEDEEELLKIQNEAASKSNKFLVKSATSDSLAILLQQSLSANDDTQLEVALQVSDKRVIENSILGLISGDSDGEGDDVDVDADAKSEMIIMLLTKLVTRIARKPSRAQGLSFWIRTVLVALLSKVGSSSASIGKTEREIVSRLGPLRNMLSERVESLPELLKLEGRLSLLSTKL